MSVFELKPNWASALLCALLSACLPSADVQSDEKPTQGVRTLDEVCLDASHDCSVCLFTDKSRERTDCWECKFYDLLCAGRRR